MSDELVLLTSEETPIYHNPKPTLPDEVRIVERYKGKCFCEWYETSEVESLEDGSMVKQLVRYVMAWDTDRNQPVTFSDGIWTEGKGCVSNATIAPGATDDIKDSVQAWMDNAKNWSESANPEQASAEVIAAATIQQVTGVDGTIPVTPEAKDPEEAKKEISDILASYLNGTHVNY